MGMRTPPSHWTAKGLGGITWDSSALALSCTSHTVRSRELTGESGQLKKKKRKALSGAREADPQAPDSGMVPERSHIFRIRRTSGPRLRVVTREFHYPGSQRNCFSHLQQLTDDSGGGGGGLPPQTPALASFSTTSSKAAERTAWLPRNERERVVSRGEGGSWPVEWSTELGSRGPLGSMAGYQGAGPKS